jgi:hypothetical protein
MTHRDLQAAKNRLDEIEDESDVDEDLDVVVLRESYADSDGESELLRKTRYYYDEAGNWVSEQIHPDDGDQ